MLLYIVKCLGMLFWTGDGVNPLDGPSLEFGQVPFARSILLMRLDGTHSTSPTCCWVMPWPTRSSRSLAPRSAGVLRPVPPFVFSQVGVS